MAELPIYLHIGDIEQPLERAAFKVNAERVTDTTFCAIAADQKFCFQSLRLAACGLDMRLYARFVLSEIRQLGLPVNVFAVCFEKIVQQMFMLALFDDKQKWIRTHSLPYIREFHRAAYLAAFDQPHLFRFRALCNQFVRQTDLLVHFQRPRLHPDSFRVRCDCIFFVYKHKIYPIADELTR